MGVRLIRENSDTPNITNKDDARMARYAYGGKNGYVQNYGNEANHYVSGNVFTIGSGIIVLQGWEVVIDSNGWQLPLSSADATKRYYSVYLEVNLALGGTASIRSQQDTYNYPDITTGDDLTQNTSGIARLELYRFTAAAGIISNITKVVSGLNYSCDIIKSIIEGALTVGNSKKLNNLEIKCCEDGILRIGEIIIPQKKLLWSGSLNAGYDGQDITLSENISEGNTLEFNYEVSRTIRDLWSDPLADGIHCYRVAYKTLLQDGKPNLAVAILLELAKTESSFEYYHYAGNTYEEAIQLCIDKNLRPRALIDATFSCVSCYVKSDRFDLGLIVVSKVIDKLEQTSATLISSSPLMRQQFEDLRITNAQMLLCTSKYEQCIEFSNNKLDMKVAVIFAKFCSFEKSKKLEDIDALLNEAKNIGCFNETHLEIFALQRKRIGKLLN